MHRLAMCQVRGDERVEHWVPLSGTESALGRPVTGANISHCALLEDIMVRRLSV